MKIDKGIYAIIILCAIGINASAQNPFWTFPEQGLEVPTTFVNPLPTDDYTGQEADYVHAGLKDPYGEIMFFAVDGRLYDKTGEERSEFDDGVDIIKGGSELLVVPKPGSCNLFYIFQTENKSGQSTDLPHFSVYNDSLGGLVEFFNEGFFKTSLNLVDDALIDGEPVFDDWELPDHGIDAIHYAATKERANGERWVFISTNNDVYRVDLDCDGLKDPDWEYDMLPGNGSYVENGWRSELELYEDTANNRYRIAAPHYNGSVPAPAGRGNVAIFDIDSASGNVIPASRFNINFPNQSNGSPTYVHGMEFSQNGKLLYFIHDPMPGYPSPFSYYDFNSATLTNLNFTGVSAFANSQIQMGGTAKNPVLIIASNSFLGTLYFPDTPLAVNWTPNAIAFSGGYSTNLGGAPSFNVREIKRIIPDQIDYMDYDSMFVKASCDCCNKYAYAKPKQDTSKIVFGSDTWSPGINNNPWNALATDTIFIRDSIYVKEDVNLTISNLNFRFGKDGVIVVKRGDETTDGAVLTLTDSTHITTDFRCSKLNYVCPDPESDDCKAIFWQGIRVEGYDDTAQATSGSTKQARLNMDKGSVIEFAQIGILAGHEKFDEYGGGLVRIYDSSLKDCLIGLRFHEYVATNGTDEIFNFSRVRNMHFYWTDTLLTYSFLPKYHVDIIESSGITMRGNLYELQDWTSYTPTTRGIGINSFNSRLSESWFCNQIPEPVECDTIVRSRFLNLVKGINATVSASSRTIEAGYGVYWNNTIGIHAIGLINPKLLDNTFRVPNIVSNSGITLTNSTGYMVENNYFTSMALSPVANNIGVYVQNSGIAMNEIYNNTFKNIALGIASVEVNADCDDVYQTGLRWKCNTFDQSIPFADIYVHSGNVSNDQGECNLPDRPAGNVFSHTSNGYDIKVRSSLDLEICNGVFFDIEYNYHDVTGGSPLVLRLKPLTYTNSPMHVNPQMCTGVFANQNDCPIKNSDAPPGKSINEAMGGKSNGLSDIDEPTLQDYEDAISLFYIENQELVAVIQDQDLALEELDEEVQSQIGVVKNQASDLWNGLISSAQWDTIGTFTKEGIWSLLSEYQPSNEAARYSSALAIEIGVETPAWIMENDNHAGSIDTDALAALEGEQLPSEIDGILADSFFNSASNTAALIALYAQNETFFLPYPMVIDNELPDSFGDEEDGKANDSVTDSQAIVDVRPNPFNENFILGLNNSDEFESSRIVIYDLLGRVLSDQNYGNNSQVEIDGSAFPSGVLIYSVYIDGALFDTGKIVKAE